MIFYLALSPALSYVFGYCLAPVCRSVVLYGLEFNKSMIKVLPRTPGVAERFPAKVGASMRTASVG